MPLRFFRRKTTSSDFASVPDLRSVPLGKVLEDVVTHFYKEGAARIVRELIESFKSAGHAEQCRTFGSTFFLLEKYLMELARVGPVSPNAIREFVVLRHPVLRPLRPFSIALKPVIEQELELARLFLSGILGEAGARVDAGMRKELEVLREWVAKVPGDAAWPVPMTVLVKDKPARPLEWTILLQHVEATLRSRYSRVAPAEDVLAVYRSVYAEISGVFDGIESFPVLYEMLPMEMLDGPRIGMIRSRRQLLEEHANIDRANRELKGANEKLHVANEENARLRAQAERNNRLLEEVLNTVGEGILSISDDGHIVTANQECSRMWGYDQMELRQLSFGELVTPECMEKVLRGEGPFRDETGHSLFGKWVEMDGLRKDGTRFPMEIQARKALVKQVNRTTLAIRDLTYNKASEEREQLLREKLDQARRMESLGMLAGGVAHDLNNILGPLVGYPSMILDLLPGDSPVRQDVEEIANSAKRASSIIQDLLTMSRRGHYEFEGVDINKLVANFVKSAEFRQRLNENPGIALNLQLDRAFPLIKGSVPHLTKVLLNLCVNAVESMSGDGELRISTELTPAFIIPAAAGAGAAAGQVVLRVRDTGCGIPQENLQRIFEPFFSTKKMGRSGSGLGLSVVFGVVQDLGGSMDVRSEPGKGTEFILRFPVAPASMVKPEEDIPRAEGGDERILIIDDEPGQRKLAHRILTGKGYHVGMAESGQDGLAFLRREPVDLVVMDMIMEPGFDGLDTYRILHRDYPHVACIIASGFSESNRVIEARSLGAQSFIKKPYTGEQLSQEVRRVLDETALIREAERIVRKVQDTPPPPADGPAS